MLGTRSRNEGWAVSGLVLVTLIWGSTFVVVKESLNAMPWTMVLALRFSFGALCLLWFGLPRAMLWPGIKLGLLLFLGFGTQTIGLETAPAGRAAFITGLSVIMVPWAAAYLLRRPVGRAVWWASLGALGGLGMLCLDPEQAEPLNRGDLWVFACSVAWSAYFLALEKPARRFATSARGAAQLTLVQVAVVAVIGWALCLPDLAVLPTLDRSAWGSMIYLGIAATAGTTLLQTVGQRFVEAARAAIIYALEPLFAAVFAWILLAETMGPVGLAGGVLMVGAMLLVAKE